MKEWFPYIELIEEARSLEQIPQTESDSEAILLAYAAYGDGFLAALRGILAALLAQHGAGRIEASSVGYRGYYPAPLERWTKDWLTP